MKKNTCTGLFSHFFIPVIIVSGLLFSFSSKRNENYPSSYSIFSNTIADMNWMQVKTAAENGAIILMTTAVIEEHGPHMGNGVDTYFGYQLCVMLKKELAAKGVNSLIVPPVYWGMNRIGPNYPGSFYVRAETMTFLLEDILTSLKSWGFNEVFNINAHGDGGHLITGIKTFAGAGDKVGIDARYLFSDVEADRIGLTGNEPFVLKYPSHHLEKEEPEFADIHAGAFETAFMVKYFPDCVDLDMVISLKPTNIKFQELRTAFDKPEESLPLGYIGNPAGYDEIDIEDYLSFTCNGMATAIENYLQLKLTK